MGIFVSSRPVWSEAVFDGYSEHRTYACFSGVIESDPGRDVVARIGVAGDGGTVLNVQKRVVPGIAGFPFTKRRQIS